MTIQTRFNHQESPRDYRTEIPNIVFELLEKREISANDLVLYATYRRIAGEHNACWYGQRALEQKCGLSDKTIKKSKINLARPFDLLGGKSLIEIIACDRKSETPEVVTIIDVWIDNHEHFKNKLTCRKVRDTGVGIRTTRVSESRRHKKEPYKKEPNKEIIAEPEKPKKEEPPPKPIPAGGNNNIFYKSLDKAYDLSDRQKQMLMKYPEPIVDKAVHYAYHPTTKIKGGPIGRIKLLQYFVRNPEQFTQSYENLDKPPEPISKKDTLVGRFKRGEIYNGFECLTDDIGIGFLKPGMQQPYSLKWDAQNFDHHFLQLLKKCKIEP